MKDLGLTSSSLDRMLTVLLGRSAFGLVASSKILWFDSKIAHFIRLWHDGPMNSVTSQSVSAKEEKKLVEDAFQFCRYFFYSQSELDEFLWENVAEKIPGRVLKEGRVAFIQWIWSRIMSKGFGGSVLQLWRQRNEFSVPNLVKTDRDFLFSLSSDLRVVLVLKDILQYEDQEILKILDLRWQVYRHRLHRARMDLLGLLSQSEAGAV